MDFLSAIRFRLYALAWLALGCHFLASEFAKSRAAYDAGDLSAYAWTGFLVFIFPWFWVLAALYVVPAVLLIEFLKWCFSE